jgi:hypothetical protein
MSAGAAVAVARAKDDDAGGLAPAALFLAHRHPRHVVGIGHHAVAARVAALDRIDHSHAVDDLAHDGVLAVQMRGRSEHDEELRVGGIRVARPGHTDGPAREWLGREFGRKIRQVRSAGSGPALGEDVAGAESTWDSQSIQSVFYDFSATCFDYI